MSPQPPPHLGREQGFQSPHPASSGSRDRAHPTFRRQSHKATPGLSPLQRVFPVSRSYRILLSSHPPDRAHFKPIPSQPPDPGGAGSSTAREQSGVTGRRKFCGVFLQGFGSLQRRLDPPAAAASHWSPSWSHRWAASSRGSSTFSLPVTMLSDVSLHPLPLTRCSVGNQILSSHFPLFEENNLSFPPESYSM